MLQLSTLDFISRFLAVSKLDSVEPVFNKYFAVFELLFKVLDKESPKVSLLVLKILELLKNLDRMYQNLQGYDNFWDRLEIEENVNKTDAIENLQFSENRELFEAASNFIDKNFEVEDTTGGRMMEDRNANIYEPF